MLICVFRRMLKTSMNEFETNKAWETTVLTVNIYLNTKEKVESNMAKTRRESYRISPFQMSYSSTLYLL